MAKLPLTPRLLSREEILAAADRLTEVVSVPEWGGAVTVRELSGTERDRYIASLYTMRSNGKGGMEVASVNTEGSSARLISMSVIDADGARLFKDSDVLDLGDKGSAAIQRVYDVAMRLSRLNETAEALAADLKAIPSDSSGSD